MANHPSNDPGVRRPNHQLSGTLARRPLTPISGIGITLAAGWASELGPVEQWPNLGRLCSYADIIPATKQTGGPGKAVRTLGVRKRCNKRLKNYILQAAVKMGQMRQPI